LVFLLALFGVGVFLVLFTQPVNAQSSVSIEITVTATILPARYVILDDDGIKQIISNTNEQVEPKVYKEKILPSNQVVLSEETLSDYSGIIKNLEGKNQIGVIYTRSLQSKRAVVTNKALQKIIFAKPDGNKVRLANSALWHNVSA